MGNEREEEVVKVICDDIGRTHIITSDGIITLNSKYITRKCEHNGAELMTLVDVDKWLQRKWEQKHAELVNEQSGKHLMRTDWPDESEDMAIMDGKRKW
jgi:hypothetical protein